MRKAIIRTVSRSKQEIPEFSVTMQMEMAAALRKKNALKAGKDRFRQRPDSVCHGPNPWRCTPI